MSSLLISNKWFYIRLHMWVKSALSKYKYKDVKYSFSSCWILWSWAVSTSLHDSLAHTMLACKLTLKIKRYSSMNIILIKEDHDRWLCMIHKITVTDRGLWQVIQVTPHIPRYANLRSQSLSTVLLFLLLHCSQSLLHCHCNRITSSKAILKFYFFLAFICVHMCTLQQYSHVLKLTI